MLDKIYDMLNEINEWESYVENTGWRGVLKNSLNRVRILHQVRIIKIFEINLKNPTLSRLKIGNVKSEVTK